MRIRRTMSDVEVTKRLDALDPAWVTLPVSERAALLAQAEGRAFLSSMTNQQSSFAGQPGANSPPDMEAFLVRQREIVEQAHAEAIAEDVHRDEVAREVAEIRAEQQQIADRRRALDYLASKQAADRLAASQDVDPDDDAQPAQPSVEQRGESALRRLFGAR